MREKSAVAGYWDCCSQNGEDSAELGEDSVELGEDSGIGDADF